MSAAAVFTLRDRGTDLRVETWVAACALVEPGHGEVRRRSTPYSPPPHTRAARVHAWGQAHPTLYAARHVAFQVVGTAAAILGIGWLKYVIGFLVAVSVATREVRRRRRVAEETTEEHGRMTDREDS